MSAICLKMCITQIEQTLKRDICVKEGEEGFEDYIEDALREHRALL